ncbi:pantoate kinase [Halohasta litorea]|uniref:Pantoate kinase n=1 Tax=Halohasta litorea TaxID=869891 RepID=A0ABD6D3K6_9EURY|nr:pantoate kinase [Halohasta litorea]
MHQPAGRPAATAFVPGHVTGFFSAHPAPDPGAAGSRGAGVALSDGVTVTVTPGSGTRLNGETVDIAPVGTVLDRLGTEASVEAETPLPIGSGFGVSGAVALGTALAANAAFDCGRTENELVEVAHCAEVEAGTGLGDVVAQARGGLPIRLEPGGPRHGTLDGLPARPRIEYVTFGELSTETVLSGDTDRLSAAGAEALDELLAEPTVDRFINTSREFADAAGLLTDDVSEAIEAVEAAGGQAAMAMLGRTVFATGTGLSDAGYEPTVCRVDAAGGRLVDRDA